jgi:uncharacterized protein (TIGR02145 family)
MEVINRPKIDGIGGIVAVMILLFSLNGCKEKNEYNYPSVETGELSGITESSVIITAKVTDMGSYEVTGRGFVWNTTGLPTLASGDTLTVGAGLGAYTASVENLLPSTKYYIRAYATNKVGTKYGGLKNFWTLGPPVLYTYYPYGVTSATATVKSNLVYIGSHPVIKMGICWSKEGTPGLSDNVLEYSGTDSTFIFQLVDLEPLTTYYVGSFATTEKDTSYGGVRTFTTLGGFVDDIDGNSYEVVRIGEQHWLSKNLRVTRYNDNTPIEKVETASEWISTTDPAYSVYDNSDTLDIAYGYLYNWYAVNSGNLCPVGWHISTDEDWAKLDTFLGDDAANKLKDPDGDWTSALGATNETNFSALPAGYRGLNGVFSGLKRDAAWWTTAANGDNYAWLREISSSSTGLARNSYLKNRGNSVRCVKD